MVNKEKIKEVLRRVLQADLIEDHNIVSSLMSACAYLFTYPVGASNEDILILQEAYMQLQEQGHL